MLHTPRLYCTCDVQYIDTCAHLNPTPPRTPHTGTLARMAGFELQVTRGGPGGMMVTLATIKSSPLSLSPMVTLPLYKVLHCVIISVSPDTHTHTRAKASLLHARTRTHMPTYTHTHTHAPACMRSHPRTHKDSRVLLRLQFRREPAQALMRVELERHGANLRLHSLR